MVTYLNKLKRYAWVAFVAVFLAFVPLSIDLNGVSPTTAQAQLAALPTFVNMGIAKVAAGGVETAGYLESKLAEVGAGIIEAGVNFGGQFLLMLGSAVLFLGGLMFDWSMDLFVVDFAAWIKSPGIWSAILSTWTIVRDVCNLVFIFGFIYIGISTIISPDSASMKRFLAKIVIGAILINFSLYLTQVIIDFTNFTAVQVYSAINPNDDASISSAIKSYLGTGQPFFNVKGTDLATLIDDWGKGAAYYFLVCIFLMVAGLTLLIAAFHLLTRFIELILIMIFSPIYFAAQVFPQTEKHAGKIMGRLVSSAFYAPAYLLLLYLVLMIANAFTEQLQGDFVAVLIQGDVGAAAVIVNYCIVIALMWSAIHLGKKMSVTGGDLAIKWGTGVRKSAQGYMARGTLRATGVNWLAKNTSDTQESWQKSHSRLKQSAALAMRTSGIDKAATSIRKASFGSGQSLADVDKTHKELKKARYESEEQAALKAVIKKGTTSTDPEEIVAFEKAVANATPAQLIGLLGAFESDKDRYRKIVQRIGHAQFDKLMDSKEEDLSQKQKQELVKVRREAIKDRIQLAGDVRNITKASIADLEALGAEISTYAQYLSAAQLDDIKKSKRFTETQYEHLSKVRNDSLKAITDTAKITEELTKRKADDAARLPYELLERAATDSAMPVDVLEKVISQNTVDRSKQQVLIDRIRTAGGDAAPGMEAFVNSTFVINRFGGNPHPGSRS